MKPDPKSLRTTVFLGHAIKHSKAGEIMGILHILGLVRSSLHSVTAILDEWDSDYMYTTRKFPEFLCGWCKTY